MTATSLLSLFKCVLAKSHKFSLQTHKFDFFTIIFVEKYSFWCIVDIVRVLFTQGFAKMIQ